MDGGPESTRNIWVRSQVFAPLDLSLFLLVVLNNSDDS
jgi:hypothetical protein